MLTTAQQPHAPGDQPHGESAARRIGTAQLRHGVDPSRQLFDFTESTAMQDVRATRATGDGLAVLAVFQSTDDAGAGCSIVAHLRLLPARQLKIDRSVVSDNEVGEEVRAFSRLQ